jgi:hypothetical protein
MSDTTNIFDLPTDPAGGGNVTNNINLTASENNLSQQPPNSQMALDQNTINQIVSGLQQASTTGITQLHSRDIPMTTNAITQDPHIQPNYIPPVQQHSADYINEYEDSNEIINSYNKNANIQNSLDDVYAEIQTPMLLAILYFLFHPKFNIWFINWSFLKLIDIMNFINNITMF